MRGESEKPLSENLIRRCEKLITPQTFRKLFFYIFTELIPAVDWTNGMKYISPTPTINEYVAPSPIDAARSCRNFRDRVFTTNVYTKSRIY